MTPRTEFRAPWGRSVRVITPVTFGVSLAIVAVVGWLVRKTPGFDPSSLLFVAGLLSAILGGTGLFAIRGYRLVAGELRVLRPGWQTTVSLTQLQRVDIDPKALTGILFKVGSAGVFGFFGWFWSTARGFFRAWVTDPARSVRLTFSDRVVVISPDDPAAFVAALRHQRGERLTSDTSTS